MTDSAIGPVLWIGAFFLLFPGNFVAGYVIEQLFWMTGVTILQMQLIHVPATLGINLAVWYLVIWALRLLAVRIRRLAGDHVVKANRNGEG